MTDSNVTLTPKDFEDAAVEAAKICDLPEGFFDPKTKMTSKLRRAFLSNRGKDVSTAADAAPEAIKTARKLAALPLAKVIRRLHQTARRAASARYILDKLAKGSKFRPPLEKEQDRQISIFRQVVAELQHRNILPMQSRKGAVTETQ